MGRRGRVFLQLIQVLYGRSQRNSDMRHLKVRVCVINSGAPNGGGSTRSPEGPPQPAQCPPTRGRSRSPCCPAVERRPTVRSACPTFYTGTRSGWTLIGPCRTPGWTPAHPVWPGGSPWAARLRVRSGDRVSARSPRRCTRAPPLTSRAHSVPLPRQGARPRGPPCTASPSAPALPCRRTPRALPTAARPRFCRLTDRFSRWARLCSAIRQRRSRKGSGQMTGVGSDRLGLASSSRQGRSSPRPVLLLCPPTV